MNWKNAYLESRILSASPLELVNILYEHAIVEVEEARHNLATFDVGARTRNISKAIAIISELESSLNVESGGEIAANLARLYQYMRERLTMGNLQKADGPLAEVLGLLESLGQAWQAINTGSTASSAAPAWTSASPAVFGEAPVASMAGWSA